MSDEPHEQLPSEPKADRGFYDKAKEKIENAGKAVVDVSKKTAPVASAIGGATEQALGKAAESAKTAAGVVGEGMDVVSGKKLLELVEQRLELQAQYNDVLAMKLEEALQRIAALELKGLQ